MTTIVIVAVIALVGLVVLFIIKKRINKKKVRSGGGATGSGNPSPDDRVR